MYVLLHVLFTVQREDSIAQVMCETSSSEVQICGIYLINGEVTS